LPLPVFEWGGASVSYAGHRTRRTAEGVDRSTANVNEFAAAARVVPHARALSDLKANFQHMHSTIGTTVIGAFPPKRPLFFFRARMHSLLL
jgi:hypothetical protein